ncbi:MAG: hypothetical protein ACFWUE_00305 [Xylanivirga thermophila]|uniref:hypothetical protein n=1 Tax=Xylanivirga thermophila TaxID=2496273 RepID=UPI0039F518AD
MENINNQRYIAPKKNLLFLNTIFIKIVLCFLSGLIFSWNCMISFEMNNIQIKATAIMILVLSIYNVLICIGNWYLTIIFSCIAYCNYSIIMVNYLSRIYNTLFTSLADELVAKIGINILLLFILVLTVLLPNKINKKSFHKNPIIYKKNRNNFIVLGICLILILILIFGFGRSDVRGERGSPTQIYEYSIIFFILGFYFCGNTKFNISMLTIILALYALQNFIYGGRVTGLQLIVCWFIMVRSYKTNIYKALPWILILFVFMSLIGIFRANFNLSIDCLKNTVKELMQKKFSLDTAYSAYHTSLTFIKAEFISSNAVRLKMFKKFLLSMILGGSRVENSSLAEFTRKYFVHYNGGILPFFSHYYLGWFGVVFSAVIVSLYCRLINKLDFNTNGLKKCISVFLVCHVFRWYLYSPSGLIRGVGLVIITYYVAYFFDLITKQKAASKQ